MLHSFGLVLFELCVGGEEHDRDSLEPADLSQEPVSSPKNILDDGFSFF